MLGIFVHKNRFHVFKGRNDDSNIIDVMISDIIFGNQIYDDSINMSGSY